MLCSSFIKERLYIGEATVATLCGIIFGPHAADLIDPGTWGNTDQITLEFSRIVLVVQCFAVGVELPKYYMEKHWRSVVLLLIPVMTFGWLVTSLFIWWMVIPLSWLESLACAACVTATDPVLASSVVGKGKFAKRIPKHLRDILSAESGCNDGMAFPFIYLALYLIQYRPDAKAVAFHWIVITILYECVFGAIYGFTIGYIGRHGIKYAERHELVDRESFLVFYFVLALFCAGSGSILGVDDLLVGFAAGVGFSNDGWFTQKTEESHVSNVIDLLINLAYFVYLGTIIPWEQYNNPEIGLTPWRLVVIAVFVIFFRRIPIMLALKPFIPDIKTWREALFAGHFGPIGVGAIFIAILARAELETESPTPLASYTDKDSENYMVVALIWPITTFLFLRRQKEEDNPSYMGSRASSIIPRRRKKKWDDGLGPGGPISQSAIYPARRSPSEHSSENTPSPRTPGDNSPEAEKNIEDEQNERDLGEVQHDPEMEEIRHRHSNDTRRDTHMSAAERRPDRNEVYQEGDDIIIEDQDGEVVDSKITSHTRREREASAKKTGNGAQHDVEESGLGFKNLKKKLGIWRSRDGPEDEVGESKGAKAPARKRGPALAYQFGKTIIVEDEDGEVVKTYEIPASPKSGGEGGAIRKELNRMGSWTGIAKKGESSRVEDPAHRPEQSRMLSRLGNWGFKSPSTAEEGHDNGNRRESHDEEEDDRHIRFTIGDAGVRLTKEDFLREIQSLDPKARAAVVDASDASAAMKYLARKDASTESPGSGRLFAAHDAQLASGETQAERRRREQALKGVHKTPGQRGRSRVKEVRGGDEVEDEAEGETAAERRRWEAAPRTERDADEGRSDDDNTPQISRPVQAKCREIRFAQSPERGGKK
ncbi:Na+/H+ antiporter nha1 [Diplocarpon rosae]|nr:Na+/H+ antiporter nha1 [Diplocarpon rosae]